MQVRQFEWDHEHTLLDGWNLAFNGSWPLQLSGKVFNNAGPGLEDGDLVEYTSQIVSFNGRVVVTKSGTKYYLGTPSPRFEAIRIQLCRASAAAEQGPAAAAALASSSFPFDVERPFRFIDLGPTVTCMHMHVACICMWHAHAWPHGKVHAYASSPQPPCTQPASDHAPQPASPACRRCRAPR